MKFYDNYTRTIKEALQRPINKSFSGLNGLDSKVAFTGPSDDFTGDMSSAGLRLDESLKPLGDLMNLPRPTDAKIGEHPDFTYIKGTSKKEFHYISSIFVDIKGSTRLHAKYDLETIFTITNTIQAAVIQTCRLFGGHIQRLQGDGVFAYFGGKNIDKRIAVERAVTAASFFSYFVKNDLKRVFEEEGVENIYTRIGIDFGDDEKVMWASFGLGSLCELTTNSLHTSLASKMQSYAGANGIVVGDFVKQRLELPEDLFVVVADKRYIYEDRNKNFYYTQYDFNWFKYLKRLPFIQESANGELFYVSPEQAEKDRLDKLRNTANLISTGSAYTNSLGSISAEPTGIKNQPHRFHYVENKKNQK